jgi:hypothetical protein
VEVFQRLLEMANTLDLDGYITPVQAWNRIKNHERFSRMTRGKLDRLETSMKPHIRCQGSVYGRFHCLLLYANGLQIFRDHGRAHFRNFDESSP